MKTLILARGVSGSGKTSFAETIEELNFGHVFPVAADDWMVDERGNYSFDFNKLKDNHSKCKATVEGYMKDEEPCIIVHNTFTKKWEMQGYFDMARLHGYTVYSIIVENRHGNASIHGVPEDKLKQQTRRFEVELAPVEVESQHLELSFSELIEAQKKVPQRPDWHPEGNNYNHTMIVLGRIIADIETMPLSDYIILSATALFHDVGKLDTTAFRNDNLYITAYGHAEASLPYWEKFAKSTLGTATAQYKDRVTWMIANHMNAKFVDNMSAEKQALLKTHQDWTLLSRFANTYDNMVELSEEERQEFLRVGEVSYKELITIVQEGGEPDELVRKVSGH